MKSQWMFFAGLLFTILVAVFAVMNVDSVSVDFMFAETEFPLILVILGSVLAGALIAGLLGSVKILSLMRQVRHLERHPDQPVSELEKD